MKLYDDKDGSDPVANDSCKKMLMVTFNSDQEKNIEPNPRSCSYLRGVQLKVNEFGVNAEMSVVEDQNENNVGRPVSGTGPFHFALQFGNDYTAEKMMGML